jgi:hypothetical protein
MVGISCSGLIKAEPKSSTVYSLSRILIFVPTGKMLQSLAMIPDYN